VTVFADTSALYALLDGDDDNHAQAVDQWNSLHSNKTFLFTTNYVSVESVALIQSRLGMEAVRAFVEEISPLLQAEWIAEDLHRAAAVALQAANRRSLSLVDLTSFETMRRLGIRRAFTFDRHFGDYGFTCLP
jgi:uncharacterized protein